MIVDLNRWVNKFDQIKFIEPDNGRHRVVFLQDLFQFSKYPTSAQTFKKVHLDCIFDKSVC